MPETASKDHEQIINALNLTARIVRVLDDKKARNVKVLGVNRQTVIADFFVIATGTSSTHIRSLSGEVEFKLKEESAIEPLRVDSPGNTDWIILDYGSVIVHIFNSEAREYYKLEKLWNEGEAIDPSELLDKLKENDK